MRVITILLAIVTVHSVQSARILGLFPHSGKSHQMVFDPLLRTLAERGHDVTVVSFFPIKDPPANYTSISLANVAQQGVETYDLSIYENPSQILKFLGLQKIAKQIMEFQPLADLATNICSSIVDYAPLADAMKKSYDVILLESFNSDCMVGLAHVHGLKAPTVALASSVLMQWATDRMGLGDNPSYVPIESVEYLPPMTFFQRLENTLLYVYYKTWYRYAIQVQEQAIIENHFGRRIPDLRDLAKDINVLLVNTFHSLNGVRPLLPGVIEVGGMHLDHKKKPIPQVSTNTYLWNNFS